MSEEGGKDDPAAAEEIQIDEKFSFEVIDLALISARQALETVATKIAHANPRLVILGDTALVEAYAACVSFMARAEKLKTTLDGLAGTLPRNALAPIQGLEGAEIAEPALLALDQITRFLARFKAETSYSGRDIKQDAAMLNPLLADALINSNLQVAVPQAFAALPSNKTSALIEVMGGLSASRAQLAAKAGTPAPADIAGVLEAAASLEAQIFGTPDSATLSKLLQGEWVKALIESHPQEQGNSPGVDKPASPIVVVTLNSVAAGGHVRTRKHLFTSLITGDQVSFSAGSAVSWYLHDLESGKLLGAGIACKTTKLRPRFFRWPWEDLWVQSQPIVEHPSPKPIPKGPDRAP